ncbi:hypothetical protein ACRE_070950 [Hapsidospora chrysogenum ATCC 11550]|uniref:Uncharacterized protein n=1 Tax=Hapsidospora chrysogenum (strain ATCC 11550 / CBS 779.69 / DSM 880 / IAM 14645 / JCM 23072 / IMI 49137) TaxID=857340 RepID=A0A086SYI1_HAPC1|nr:hypothetical protein ACRE_070950 [Hapsidospora chrysogenum ATCC 11550]
MAREVIDLISSSPPPGPSPTELPAARTTRYNDLDRAERTVDSAGVNLDGLSDEFDTTGDLDFFVPTAGTEPTDAKRRPAASAGGASLKPSLPEASLFLSDDFDTTGDLNDPIPVEGAGNKRRRISPSPAAARVASATKAACFRED